MNATIFIIREWEGIEYHFAVEVGLDRDGDVDAIVGEDVPERYWSTRYGGLEIEETGYLKFSQGEEIVLEDDELEDAREAIADMESAWAQERARLKDILRPEGGGDGAGGGKSEPAADSIAVLREIRELSEPRLFADPARALAEIHELAARVVAQAASRDKAA